MTPLRAIRAKCLDCCCGQVAEVRRCPSKSCALWPYRFGKNPARAGIGGRASPAEPPNSRPDFQQEGGEGNEP